MSIDIESLVRRIIKDECEGCEDECELCKLGPCEHLVTHVGLFFIEWAIDEFEKKQEEQ